MGDLISKAALFNALANAQDKAEIFSIINAAPTVDAEPVRHGHWIGLEYDSYSDGNPVWDLWGCSECGEEESGEDVPLLYPYCHYCGAKMGVPKYVLEKRAKLSGFETFKDGEC